VIYVSEFGGEDDNVVSLDVLLRVDNVLHHDWLDQTF
jgi:hypothetical protein